MPIQSFTKKKAAVVLTIISLFVAWDYCRTPPRKDIPLCTSKNPLAQVYHFYQWHIRGHRGTEDRIEQKIRISDDVYEYKYVKIRPRGIGLLVENYKAIMLALTLPLALERCIENIKKYESILETVFYKYSFFH